MYLNFEEIHCLVSSVRLLMKVNRRTSRMIAIAIDGFQ